MERRFASHETIVPIGEAEQQVYNQIMDVASEAVLHRRYTDPVEGMMLANLLQQMAEYGYGHADQPAPWAARTTGLIDPILKEAVAFRRAMGQSIDPAYLLRLVEFSIDMQACELFPEEYPKEAHRSEFWYDNRVFDQLNYDALREELLRELASCMIDGYAFYHVLTNALAETLGYEQTVLDHGRSMGIPERQWILGGSKIEVYKEPASDQAIAPETMIPDEEFQEKIDRLTAMKPAVSRIVGYDRSTIPMGPDDLGFDLSLRRMKSHTFPMSEAMNRAEELDRFYKLAYFNSPKLVSPEGSISADDPAMFAKIRPHLPSGKVDINIYQAMLFEQTSEARQRIEENRKRHFSDSWVFKTDFYRPQNRKNPTEPAFIRHDWWHHPGTFATFAHDPKYPDRPPLEIARFLTRRGTQMWLTDAGKRLLSEGRIYD